LEFFSETDEHFLTEIFRIIKKIRYGNYHLNPKSYMIVYVGQQDVILLYIRKFLYFIIKQEEEKDQDSDVTPDSTKDNNVRLNLSIIYYTTDIWSVDRCYVDY